MKKAWKPIKCQPKNVKGIQLTFMEELSDRFNFWRVFLSISEASLHIYIYIYIHQILFVTKKVVMEVFHLLSRSSSNFLPVQCLNSQQETCFNFSCEISTKTTQTKIFIYSITKPWMIKNRRWILMWRNLRL